MLALLSKYIQNLTTSDHSSSASRSLPTPAQSGFLQLPPHWSPAHSLILLQSILHQQLVSLLKCKSDIVTPWHFLSPFPAFYFSTALTTIWHHTLHIFTLLSPSTRTKARISSVLLLVPRGMLGVCVGGAQRLFLDWRTSRWRPRTGQMRKP